MLTTEEADSTIAALKRPKHERPLIAIIGINDATETTDYLMSMASFGVPASPMWWRLYPRLIYYAALDEPAALAA
jgi:hypothetical protein